MPIVTGLNANVFRAVSGSLFSSPINWSRGVVPTGSDVALIADNCTIDVSRTIGSLIVQPGFTASINTGLTLQVRDVINCLGHISCSGNPTITSVASKNVINSFSPASSTFIYSGSSRQSVAGTTYNTLRISGTGNKTLNANLIVSGNLFFDTAASLDLFSYDMTVSGSTNLGSPLTTYRLIKSKPGNVLFNGGTAQETFVTSRGIDFSGNPNVEVRNGLTITEYQSSPTNIISGYGNWVFSTNNQNLSCLIAFYGDVLVSGSINLNMQFSNVGLYKPINGTTGSASLTNRGIIYYYTANAGNNMMRTGSFDFLTYANTQNYVIDGPYTLPYTTYRNLGIGNPEAGSSTGTIFLRGNTVVSGSLTVVSSHYLDCSSASLEVTGSTYVQAYGTILKSSNIGRAIFNGNFRGDFFGGAVAIDFSASNASAEFRNGIYTFYYQGNTVTFKTGTGSWYFTTNNQAINSSAGSGNATFTTTYDCPIIISGAITLDITNTNLYFNNSINGTEPNSKFKNSSVIYFATSKSLSESFLTGSYDFTSSVNTVYVGGDYTATIPARFSSSFYNLGISGTGIKTLGTSSYLSGSLTFLDNTAGILDLGNHNITISGSANLNYAPAQLNTQVLRKTGPGSVTFIGRLTVGNWAGIQFDSGSPNVEFRNGLNLALARDVRSGTGSWSFTTNNQEIGQSIYGSTLNFDGPVIIGPGISLTMNGPHSFYINNNLGISGSSPTSRLILSSSLYFNNANAPTFINGIFDYTGSTNTIGYTFNGDYTLPYTYYSSLVIQGTGSKSVSGNTTISGSLTIPTNQPGILELGNYDLFVSGTTTLNNQTPNTQFLRKSGSGSVVFNGTLLLSNYGVVDFESGSPNVEIRNGISLASSQNAIRSGTGSWTFTTNNQTIGQSSYGDTTTFNCTMSIAPGINVTLGGSAQHNLNIYGVLNGQSSTSKFTLGSSNPIVSYYNSTQPMITGVLDASSSLGVTFIYASGSQDVKGGVYRNLTFLNGVKTLQGNVSVLGTFSTGSGATSGSVNLNGYTLTNP